MGSGVLLAALVVLWFVVLVPMVVTRGDAHLHAGAGAASDDGGARGRLPRDGRARRPPLPRLSARPATRSRRREERDPPHHAAGLRRRWGGRGPRRIEGRPPEESGLVPQPPRESRDNGADRKPAPSGPRARRKRRRAGTPVAHGGRGVRRLPGLSGTDAAPDPARHPRAAPLRSR